MSILSKALQAVEARLDSTIAKAKAESEPAPQATTDMTRSEHVDNDRKGFIEMDLPMNDQGLFREDISGITREALRNMARRDSIIIAVHQCLINQLSNFTQPQVDKYSPGYRFRALKPADLTREEKLSLNDPDLSDDEFKALEYELESKRSKLQDEQDADIEKLAQFIKHCGSDSDETNTTYKRQDFDKFIKLVGRDILTYNYMSVELIPNKGKDTITSFSAVSAKTIRYVSNRDASQTKTVDAYIKNLLGTHASTETTEANPYRYAQVLRGRPVAAWTENDFIYEPKNPTVDPEDYGYAQGELHWLVNIVTNHLYAENHNRNYFVNGTTKGLLHIKGDNINRAQLEGFKRNWFSQLAGTNNSFRPPILGMADDVKWVPLTQTNAEMEFQEWMAYLIKIICAFYQIDPAEINFDISKTNTGTLNEANNEQRIKSSKNKGLRPLLMFLQNVVNNQIMPRYSKEMAKKYIFEFVGLDAETKKQEIDRLKDESQVYRTINEIRTEQGLAPIESGNIILAAQYTQYLAQEAQAAQAAQQAQMGAAAPGDPNGAPAGSGDDGELTDDDVPQDDSDISSDIDSLLSALDEPSDKPKADDKKPADDVKKALTVEYHHYLNKE